MFPKLLSLLSLWLLAITSLLSPASAERVLEATSLNACMEDSRFSATFFRVSYTPDNSTLNFAIYGLSDISGYVVLEFKVFAYGFQAVTMKIDPAKNPDLAGLNPMNPGPMDLRSSTPLPDTIAAQIPGIAYTVPDIDGKVQIYINETGTGKPLACVEAELSNGKTVYQKAVGWVTAVIAGLGLATSAIASGLGHSDTAAHLAANAMSLFGFFQAQAFAGMMSVHLPPIVAAWTQNFQWSMGIIRVGFLQRMCTWYQRATGGVPAELLSKLSITSVRIQKRAVDTALSLVRRTNSEAGNAENRQVAMVRGIERVGFKARIEATNIFLTGHSIFVIFVILVVIGVVVFKFVCEGLARAGRMKNNKFQDFRNGWTTVLKGILFRIVLIGFPQMVLLCFWEMTVRDSSAEVVLAVFTIFTMIALLSWSIFKVWRIAQQSMKMYGTPVYDLYSDPVSLNKWGFLYVQFQSGTYYFIGCTLIYILVKGMFIGLSQNAPKVQGVAILIIEGAYLVLVSVLRPYMDKMTNGYNIAIAAVNFLNAIFLLVFSNLFGQPDKVSSVMGVIFFVYNVIAAFALLMMVLASSLTGVFSKNPERRYRPMSDDRGSFIKNQSSASKELTNLATTARGEPGGELGADEYSTSSGEHKNMYALNSQGPVSNPGHGYRPPMNPFEPNASFPR